VSAPRVTDEHVVAVSRYLETADPNIPAIAFDLLDLRAEHAALEETVAAQRECLATAHATIAQQAQTIVRLREALRAVQHNRLCACYGFPSAPCIRCKAGYDEVDAALSGGSEEAKP
jgi:uncharacterized coiled-coil protein SlyX